MSLRDDFTAAYGARRGLARLWLYPFTLLAHVPGRLVRTLWRCRVLAQGKWSRYGPQFSAYFSFNLLNYWRLAFCFDRYGRGASAPVMGLGDFHLGKMFVNTLPSLYAQWRFGPVVSLLGMFGWLLSQGLWVSVVPGWWAGVLLLLVLASTNFYVNVFVRQNYNALGWAFFGAGLFGLATGNYVLSCVSWLAVSFFSFTATVMAAAFCAGAGLATMSLAPVAIVLPACLKITTHLLPGITGERVRDKLWFVVSSLGATTRNVKYRYRQEWDWCQIEKGEFFHHLLLYLQFIAAAWLLAGSPPYFALTGLVLFTVNNTASRFADAQTDYMVALNAAVATAMLTPSPWLLLPFWLLISPLPRYLNMRVRLDCLEPDKVPVLAPFDMSPVLDMIGAFFAPVRSGGRVFMAFEDPKGLMGNVFDRQRILVDLATYATTMREVHFMPDMFAIYDLNHKDAQEVWGRDLESVKRQIALWRPDFVACYLNDGEAFDPVWEENGFEIVSRLDWRDMAALVPGDMLVCCMVTRWLLLRVPDTLAA
jgi:hypothetical protein